LTWRRRVKDMTTASDAQFMDDLRVIAVESKRRKRAGEPFASWTLREQLAATMRQYQRDTDGQVLKGVDTTD
jgi:hypothetical protein